MKNKKILTFWALTVIMAYLGIQTVRAQDKFNIDTYLNLGDHNSIYPTDAQLKMLSPFVPDKTYHIAPSIYDRSYWHEFASSKVGEKYYKEALELKDKEPEIPISDEIYRRANKEGNRQIYKPRYYRTMDRLEHFILAECIENKGQFIPQIETYCTAIMKMKSWMHPNHDDAQNSVLEGKRVAIDLGARKFGSVLSLANVLLENKLPENLKNQILQETTRRITDSYMKSTRGEDNIGNKWIRSTSNWNAVCTSGSLFTILTMTKNREVRTEAIGCALNSMEFYLSGFGKDGYCSEGAGYWGYGFGHYLYLAQMLKDYTQGSIDLFTFNCSEKLKNVGNFLFNFQVHPGMYPPFSDGVTHISDKSDNFAALLSAKYYGYSKPKQFISDEAVERIMAWPLVEEYVGSEENKTLPNYTYFDDFGIIISRGKESMPFSIAIKGGHNAENHNHSDVGSYVIYLSEDLVAGDIGAPSYTAGAFSPKNPARSSWGHPVPLIDGKLQSNGKHFSAKVVRTSFKRNKDIAVLDIKGAYDVDGLTELIRTMENNKKGKGEISITDEFKSDKALSFGTAIMVNVDYKIQGNTVLLTSDHHIVKVVVTSNNNKVILKGESVPVKHLRSGRPSSRIGVNFEKPLKSGAITVTYIPIK
ncbi:MAG: heparinase II/III family protein [Bacteroidales bacterium]